jgi:hypothetical protein
LNIVVGLTTCNSSYSCWPTGLSCPCELWITPIPYAPYLFHSLVMRSMTLALVLRELVRFCLSPTRLQVYNYVLRISHPLRGSGKNCDINHFRISALYWTIVQAAPRSSLLPMTDVFHYPWDSVRPTGALLAFSREDTAFLSQDY